MKFSFELIEGRLLKREKRFISYIDIGNEIVIAHVPNTGRMEELVYEGVRVLVSQHNEESRKTKFELRMIEKNELWVSIDSQLPNKLALEAIQNNVIDELIGFKYLKNEVKFKNSRFDLVLSNNIQELIEIAKTKGKSRIIDLGNNIDLNKNTTFIEVKGVTLEENGWAYFPDAPTERGTKHVLELIELKKMGYDACVLFIIQHPNITGFSPNWENDPKFSHALKTAYESGVKILPYLCEVNEKEVFVYKKVDLKF